MEIEAPQPLIILGRTIGTYTGWDDCGADALNFYDFVAAPGIVIPSSSCLYTDFGKGQYECYADDEEGTVFERGDLITALRDLPLSPPAA